MGIDDGATPCHIGTDGSLVTGDMGDKLGYWGVPWAGTEGYPW